MKAADSAPHYIAPTKTARWPRTFVYLDTEAARDKRGAVELQGWRLGCAAIDRRRHDGRGWAPRAWLETTDRGQLWDWITVNCERAGRTVLVAHNLAYDLRIAAALPELLARGFELERISLDRETAWASWRRGRDELVAVDLSTFLPRPLAEIGAMLGLVKPPLPRDRDPDRVWLERCRADVEILAAAWREIADWIGDGDLGGFAATGSGVAWQVWRHRYLHHPVLARVDQDVADACRLAAWTGRCEAWRLGVQPPGRYVEWDYQAAYGFIGRDDEVPCSHVDRLDGLSVETARRVADRKHLLAEVEVQTDVPALPCRLNGRIAWPIGRFTTTVWWGEVEDALKAGAQVRMVRGWSWKRGPALREFMTWALRHAAGVADDAGELRGALAKQWTRALVGRMGMRYTDWQVRKGFPAPGLYAGVVAGPNGDRARRMMLLGSDWYEEAGQVDGMDTAVQVMSYVMSQTRRLLWRAMRVAGLDDVVYCDTDGLIVTEDGDRRLGSAGLRGLRRKATYRGLELLGPRQVILDGAPRVAGLPRKARQVGEHTFEVEQWQRMEASLRDGRADQVKITTRRVTLRGTGARRLSDGLGGTVPILVDRGPNGAAVVVNPAGRGWPRTK